MHSELPLPSSYLRSKASAPPMPTYRPDIGYRRVWFYCPVCGQWRWVPDAHRKTRLTCSKLCYRRLHAQAANEQRGRCPRPGCGRWRKKGLKTCGARCGNWLKRRTTIGRPRSTKPRSYDCVVCHRHCEKAFPSEVPKTRTCGRQCEGVLKHRRWLARHLRRAFKIAPRRPPRWGVMAGFEIGLRVVRAISVREKVQLRAALRHAKEL